METTTLTATTTLLLSSKTLRRSTTTQPPPIRRTQSPLLRSLRITTTVKPPSFDRRTAVAAVSPVFASGADDNSPSSSDVIVLDVRGMMCDGCASSVKRILENQSQVSSASVDHTTGSAIVYPVSEAKVTPNWQKVIGEEIAKNLTNCGFDSNLRGCVTTAVNSYSNFF
ncbi:hypothetical protein M8C21_011619 [Ambrosia artemisiifolia]|uniref:HMA domain-containing protein n=1 Tax=Ambrosia artemisiifolia TaxID=4212 RepID=A0AAD5GHA0_AMBAR|nr:hypothetical protein M8C21_011619 [Ambrosia artemisiifolia]